MEEGIRTKSKYVTRTVAFVIGQVLIELRVLLYLRINEAENTN